MPRFNAAKSWKKLDDDLSGKFNYLCDLLDEGYSSVALINNHEIAIDINPKDGINIVNDGSSIFSLDPLTGEIVIGKYDDLISDLETDLGTAYNDIAQQLGYADYDDMVAEAIAGNTIINGGWLRTSLIQANTILFDQLASSTFNTINYLSGNLIQNVTMENSMDRWTGDGTLVDSTYEGLTIKAIQLYSNTTNKWAYSEWFRIDPAKAYEVSFLVRKFNTEGRIYIGANFQSSSGGVQSVTSASVIDGSIVSLSDSNFYFSYNATDTSPSDWIRVVGYIMPAGTPADKCKGLGEYGGTMGNSKVAILHADNYEARIRVGNYDNSSASYLHIANCKVTQADAQSVIKMVQSGVSYAGVVIDATNGFVSTATVGGNTVTAKANATDGFSIYKGAVKMFGVDTDGRVFASSLSNVDIAGYHMTYGYGGSPGLECFHPVMGTPTKFLGISPSTNSDIYIYDKNSKNRVQVWVDGTFRITDHNQATRMYLYPDGGIEFKDINGNPVIAANGGALEDVYLACKNAPTMKVGANSTGPFYDHDGARVYFDDVPSKLLATSVSSGAGGASKWIRVARFTFWEQFSNVSVKIEVVGTASSIGAGMGCTLYFTGVQQAAFPNNPVGNLYLSNAVNITSADLEARVTYTASDATVVEIYVKSIHDYKYVRTFRIAEYIRGNVLPDYTMTSWLAAAPSGTDLGKVLSD